MINPCTETLKPSDTGWRSQPTCPSRNGTGKLSSPFPHGQRTSLLIESRPNAKHVCHASAVLYFCSAQALRGTLMHEYRFPVQLRISEYQRPSFCTLVLINTWCTADSSITSVGCSCATAVRPSCDRVVRVVGPRTCLLAPMRLRCSTSDATTKVPIQDLPRRISPPDD